MAGETQEKPALRDFTQGVLWCALLTTALHGAVALGVPWYVAVCPFIGFAAIKIVDR